MADQNKTQIDQLFEEAYAVFEQKQRMQPNVDKSKFLSFTEPSHSLDEIIGTLPDHVKNGKEVEVRFGWFNENRFSPGVPKEYFYNLLEVLSKKMPKVKPVKSMTWIKDNIRVVEENGKQFAEIKHVESQYDDKEWGIRISIASEEKIKKVPNDLKNWFQRAKTRWTFPIDNRQLDLTIVGGKDITFEVEIEYIKASETNVTRDCAITYSHMQKTHIDQILSQTQIKQLMHNYNMLIVDPRKQDAAWVKRKFDKTENKPQSFQWNNVFSGEKYFITPKLDGVRKRLFFDINGVFEITPDSNCARIIDYPFGEEGTIIDTEYYNGKYYPFDVLVANSVSLLTMPFETRYSYINIGYESKLDYSKPFYSIDGFFGDLTSAQKWMKEHKGMKFDGFIAQSNEPIYVGLKTMKIKPLDELTVDLLTKIDEKRQVRLYAYSETEDVEVNFNPKNVEDLASEMGRYTVKNLRLPDTVQSGAIAEYHFINKEPWLRFKGLRTDKLVPNFYKTVNNVYRDYFIDPTSIDDLTDKTLLSWRKWASLTKRTLINTYVNVGDRVLDIGIGRGGTLLETVKVASQVYGIDPDKANLASLQDRMESASGMDRVQLANIKGQDTDQVLRFIGSPVNAVLSMFSLSFFFENEKVLDAFVQTCVRSIGDGGRIIIMFMDGGQLSLPYGNDLLTIESTGKNGEITIKLLKEPNPIFRIQKEWLVDFSKLVDKFNALGVNLIIDEFMNKGAVLPPLNMEFAGLNRVAVFEKRLEEKSEFVRENFEINVLPVGQDIIGDKWIRHGIEWDTKSFVRSYLYHLGKGDESELVNLSGQLTKTCTAKTFATLENGRVRERIAYNLLYTGGIDNIDKAYSAALKGYQKQCSEAKVGHEASGLLVLIKPKIQIVIISDDGSELKRYGKRDGKTYYIMKIGNYAYSPISPAPGYTHKAPVKPVDVVHSHGLVKSGKIDGTRKPGGMTTEEIEAQRKAEQKRKRIEKGIVAAEQGKSVSSRKSSSREMFVQGTVQDQPWEAYDQEFADE